MWKKNIAKLLVFAMLLTMLPIAAVAAPEDGAKEVAAQVSATYVIIKDVKVAGTEERALTCANPNVTNNIYEFGSDTISITPNTGDQITVSFNVTNNGGGTIQSIKRGGSETLNATNGVVKDSINTAQANNLSYEIVAGKQGETPVNYTLKLKFKIEGEEPPASTYSIEMDVAELTVEEGATKELTATLKKDGEPVDAEQITWKSEATATAKVEGNVLTGVKEGKTFITASATYEGKTVATEKFPCTVTAKIETDPTIELSEAELSFLKIKEDKTLTATVQAPEGSTLKWESSDEKVATVTAAEDGKSATVTSVANGEATITVTVTTPGKKTASDECKVTVKVVEGLDEVKKTEMAPPAINSEALENANETEKGVMQDALSVLEGEDVPEVADLTGAVEEAVESSSDGGLIIEGQTVSKAAINEVAKTLEGADETLSNVRTVIVPKIVINIAGAKSEGTTVISLSFEISAFAEVKVTTAPEKENLTESNSKSVGEPVDLKETKKNIKITLPLPDSFTIPDRPVVRHEKGGGKGTYLHRAYPIADTNNLWFNNDKGFSTFTVEKADAAALVGETYYATLQEAVDAVENNGTIIILKDKLTATVSKVITFTVKFEDDAKEVTITADSKHELTQEGNKYIFTEKKSGSDNKPGSSGGGGGGGSSKPAIKPGDQNKPTTPTTTPGGGVAGFNDVATSAWYADSVKYVVDKGLFGGVGNGNFAPNANMTRAMMWTVLARYMGVNTNTGSNWYEAARTWAMAQNISDGTMADGNVTREQFVTMLWRLSGEPAVETSASFTDNGSISGYAKTAVDWAVAQGILNGYNDGSFRPQGSATRAEVAKMLTVFCQNADNAEPTESETESEA